MAEAASAVAFLRSAFIFPSTNSNVPQKRLDKGMCRPGLAAVVVCRLNKTFCLEGCASNCPNTLWQLPGPPTPDFKSCLEHPAFLPIRVRLNLR